MTIVGSVGGGEVEPPVIYVEVGPPLTAVGGPTPRADGAASDWNDDVRNRSAQKLVESAHDLVGDGVALARACAQRFSVGLRELPKGTPVPDEVELQLGITLDAELGAVLAKTKVSAQLQLTLRWQNGLAG